MAFLLWNLAVFAQIHTVEKGETLQSIAEKYHVSISSLVAANPGADNLFYVGLKLNIPEQEAQVASPVSEQVMQTDNNPSVLMLNTGSEFTETDDSNLPGVEPAVFLEYGFLSKMDGVSGSNYTYAFTVGGNYYFLTKGKGVFAGARIGYNSANYNMWARIEGVNQSQTSTSHFITVPVNVGYAIASENRNMSITPYAGFDFNFCVGSKNKYKAGQAPAMENKFKKKVGMDARVGLQLRIFGFNVGGSYVIPLNKNQKDYFGEDAYLAINIGFGF